MSFVKVADATEVPVGGMIQVTVDEMDIAVYHLKDGFYATSDVCTHRGESLTTGTLEGNIVACPKHGGKFDVCTGAATAMPCVTPVETYVVEVRDDEVWLDFE